MAVMSARMVGSELVLMGAGVVVMEQVVVMVVGECE